MLLQRLKREVLHANQEIVRQRLVVSTFGNVSGKARDQSLVAIKPSGVPYDALTPEDTIITDLEEKIVERSLRPSFYLATHLVFYRAFPQVGGVVHTQPEYAIAWTQAGKPIPCYGTTYADY